MCGIAGFVGPEDRDALHRMARALAHRGPDGDGFLEDAASRVHLAHRRLAILDIAGGHQPMRTPDGSLSVVFNGQIYNFAELRAELEMLGARFVSDHSDTEVLLHAWRHWGAGMVQRLNGMWAFALHDRERRLLFCSRDRFGKKPFFYFSGSDHFVFASELIALREHPRVPSALDELALRKYYAYGYVPAPRTFLAGVRKLPAGHNLTLDLASGSLRIERYWRYLPEPFEERPAGAEARWAEELLGRLDAAVARRLVADVPVGAFLSGGIDSSTVAALAMRHVGQDRLKTFSIAFDEASFDESAYAQIVARHIGAEHHVDTLGIARALEILPEVARRLDEPIADSSLLPTFLVSRFARRHVTVALGGDGADELLAGYDPFRALRYARAYERLVPRPLHRAISLLAARLPVSHRYMSFDFRLKRTLRGLDHAAPFWLPVWMAPVPPAQWQELFQAPVDCEEIFSEAIEAWDECPRDCPVERTIAFYVRTYLQDDILVKVDRASMMNSLEVRAPFLDADVVDFTRRLPADMKLRGGQTKYLLRRAVEQLLPAPVLTRSKQGFAVPVGRWFRDGAMPPWRAPAGPASAFRASRLAAHRSGRADERLFLWSDWILDASHLGALRAAAEGPA
ncbi:MAG: asparagine synthase (glutamine-hydrolyzing) [Lysobacterales bacterium]